MKPIRLFCFLLCLSVLEVKSQDSTSTTNPSKFDFALEGMVGMSIGKNFFSWNVGGPGFYLVVNKNFKVGVGALPSLFLLNGKLGARLAVAPRIDYKNYVFVAPFFHRDVTGEWISSIGLGYKFHKKKTKQP